LAWERVRSRPPLEKALAGGEDYELLFTTRRENKLKGRPDSESVPLTRIGTVTEASEGIRLILREGSERELSEGGWDHFRAGKSPS
jgi:thiamine-monophosphate kinase